MPIRADVAIAGSGYTGLSAALTLARAGRNVVVLEADVPGHGASTRNGGQIGTGNQKIKVATLVDLYGQSKAKALLDEGSAAFNFTTEFIERERLDCHFQRVGRFRGAVRPGHYDAMAREMEALRKLTATDFFMVPRTALHSELGSDRYFGGMVLPNDASLHPALYHRGLLDRVKAAGATVLAHTPVAGVQREGMAFRIKTPRGQITAKNVIIATNGYTGPTTPYFYKRIVPVGTAIIATEEIPESIMLRAMPRRRVYGCTARVFHYFRPSPDGKRMLWGGRIGRWVAQNSIAAYRHLRTEMVRYFPDLVDVKVTHGWWGYIAYTFDTMPHLGCIDGIHYAMGYCGNAGVARGTYLGHKIALRVLGKPDSATAFDDLMFPSHPFHFLARPTVPLYETWYRVLDAIGM